MKALAAVLIALLAAAPAAAQPTAKKPAPARPRPAAGPRHKTVIAPLATLGSESKAADVKAAQALVGRGIATVRSIELVKHQAMLDAVKRAKRPELRACDGDVPCLVALGQLLGADYAVFGEVGGLGNAQVIYLKLIDVRAAREVRSTVLELDGTRSAEVEARAAATRLVAPARYVGQLALATTVQGASVYIDGELVARTPTRPLSLPVGAHALRVTHPEFRDFVRFVEIGFAGEQEVSVALAPYDAVSGDIRRTRRDQAIAAAGPGAVEPTPWYRRWYTVAGGAAVLVITSALVVSLAADGIDFDREMEVP